MAEVPGNIRRAHIEQAIGKIDAEGIPGDAHSSTYDVLFNGNRYPPKLVISYSNLFANTELLDRNTFRGGENTPCFKKLTDEGFEIVSKPFKSTESQAWLLTWNPKRYTEGGDGSEEGTLNISQGETVRWSCISKSPKIGDAAYLLRQGIEPKGIIAKCIVAKEPFLYEDWKDDTKQKSYIEVTIDDYRPDCASGLVPMLLLSNELDDQHWNTQSSGIAIKSNVIESLDSFWTSGKNRSSLAQFVSWSSQHDIHSRPSWLKGYKKSTSEIDALKQDPGILDEELLHNIWKKDDNGICNVKPGFLSNADYDKNKEFLYELTREILKDQGTQTAKKVFDKWEGLKQQGLVRQIYTAVIHRVFAAVSPERYTTILKADNCKKLLEIFEDRFGLKNDRAGDWFSLNAEIMRCLAEAEVKETQLEQNIAMWQLYAIVHEPDRYNTPSERITTEQFLSALIDIEPSTNEITYLEAWLFSLDGHAKPSEIAQECGAAEANPAPANSTIGNVAKKISEYLELPKQDAVWINLLAEVEQESDTWVWHAKDEFIEAFTKFIESTHINPQTSHSRQPMNGSVPLNRILYGPPGTGKTFHTINEALGILDPNFLAKHSSDRKKLKTRFDDFSKQKRIHFVTFHQSFSYEDFVEGLKATTENGVISYSVEPGIFRRACEAAEGKPGATSVDELINKFKEEVSESPQELSTPTGKKFTVRYSGGSTFLCDPLEAKVAKGLSANIEQVRQLIHGTTPDNLYCPSYAKGIANHLRGNSRPSATRLDVGQTFGGYTVVSATDEIVELRKPQGNLLPYPMSILNEFKQHVTDGSISIEDIGDKSWQQKLNTDIEPHFVNGYQNLIPKIVEAMVESASLSHKESPQEPVVLIIDEINRGNISSIFGELITLIEPSKRAGAEEALTVTLPYSKTKFQVPENLHIIGTMNTADRSLALMDTALRRRFDFVEMMPKASEIKGLEVSGIDVSRMLEKINQRIEYLYDREHTLGHAFFIPLKDITNEADRFLLLQQIFANKVLPLLEEYFFEDWEKIRLVLGDNNKEPEEQFVTLRGEVNVTQLFGDNDLETFIDDEPKLYERNEAALLTTSAYIKIYET